MMIPKQKLLTFPSTESGFTLIECLIAIIIVSVLMVAVAPALVVSTATRVQARRVELATQAAQAYMDGLRAGKIPPPPYGAVLKQDQTNWFNKNLLDGYPAPTPASSWTCQLTAMTPSTKPVKGYEDSYYCKDAANKPELYCVDLDRDAGCTKGDYIVQGFRSFLPSSTNPNLPDLSDDGSQGYMLGIRVYRADAMTISGALKTTVNAGKSRKLAAYTGGAGDRATPLVETTTQIRPTKNSYESLKERLGVKPD